MPPKKQKPKKKNDQPTIEVGELEIEDMSKEPVAKKPHKKQAKKHVEKKPAKGGSASGGKLPKFKTKKRRSSPDIEQDLTKIYKNEAGELPDFTTVERSTRRKSTKFLIFLIWAVGIFGLAAAIGYFVFSPLIRPGSEALAISIEGPEDVQVGKQVIYEVTYANNGTQPIASLDVEIKLPDQFHLEQAQPANTEGSTRWQIGTVSTGSDGLISLQGYWLSEVPSSATLQAIYTYKPANFSSEFQEITTKTVSATEPAVDLVIEGPEKTLPGEDKLYSITIQNTSERELTNLELRANLPEGFIIASTEPELPEGASAPVFNLETLPREGISTINIIGAFDAATTGLQELVFDLYLIDSDDNSLRQKSETVQTDVLGADVSAVMIINGSNEDKALNLGDMVRISLDITNNTDQEIQDIEAVININPTPANILPLDFEQAMISDEGVRRGGAITWTEDEIAEFNSLEAEGEKGVFVSIPIKELIEAEVDEFEISATVTVGKIGTFSNSKELRVAPITIRVNSDLKLYTTARYFNDDGQPVGTGELPPMVGETTMYRLRWIVANSLHEVTNIKLTATLPPGVSWMNHENVDAGSLNFDQQSRVVTWDLNRLPIDVGSALAEFDVAISPTADDVGKFLKLSNEIELEALDTVTGDEMEIMNDILTTELIGDDFAAGKGVVVE